MTEVEQSNAGPNRRQSLHAHRTIGGKRGSIAAVSALTRLTTSPRLPVAGVSVAPAPPPKSPPPSPLAARMSAVEHRAVVDAWLSQVKDASVVDNSFTLLAIVHYLGIQINESVEKIVEKFLHMSEHRISLEQFVSIVEACKAEHERARRRPSFRQKDLFEAVAALTHQELGNQQDPPEAVPKQPVATEQTLRRFSSTGVHETSSLSETEERSGQLDTNEMKDIIRNFHLGLDAEGLLRELDQDQDSHVDFNELMALLMSQQDSSPTSPTGSEPSFEKSVHMNALRVRSMRRVPRKSVVALVGDGVGHAGLGVSMSGAGGSGAASGGGAGEDLGQSVRHSRSNINRFISKNPLAMTAFYRALQNAATNVSDMEQFRSRCGALMASADRLGEPRQKTDARGPRRPATAGGYSSFSRLATDNRERVTALRSANKASIAQRLARDKEQQDLKSRVEKIQQALDKKLEERLEECLGSTTATGNLHRVDSERRSLRTGSVAFSELEDIAAENDDDDKDDSNSVYSTSSSQRSIDLKQSVSLSREPSQSMLNAPAHGSESAAPAANDAPFTLPQSRASFRTRSVTARQSVASNGTSRTNVAKRTNIGDRRVLSTQIIVRLTQNTNQVRMHKITAPTNPVGSDGQPLGGNTSGRAKTAQVPSMITARTRAKKTKMTNEDKVTSCMVDDYGEERLECDTKLFECYFGKT